MSVSKKYGRTYHYPFSPGTTQDDRVNHTYWDDLGAISQVIHTEKLDGENNCLNRYGVFARSHATPTTSPWTQFLRRRWEVLRHDLSNLELFGENLYAIHSISYPKLEQHFFVFGIRENERWLSWEETEFWCRLFDFPTVPVITEKIPSDTEESYRKAIIECARKESAFGSMDTLTHNLCSMEGIVTRNAGEYSTESFGRNVFKYVRANHVQTDEHWTRNWERAQLISEKNVADQ